jgi:hypothetical protein
MSPAPTDPASRGTVDMTPAWRAILWRQFGAAIDTLGDAIRGCPEGLWRTRLWDDPTRPPVAAEYWYVAYHTRFWLDLYLSGAVEGFAPPEPFDLGELDPAGRSPDRVYGRDELLAYLAHCRGKCRETIGSLSHDAASRRCAFGWGEVPFAELLLYSMRHVQEHAAQMHMQLGRESSTRSKWVAKARERPE